MNPCSLYVAQSPRCNIADIPPGWGWIFHDCSARARSRARYSWPCLASSSRIRFRTCRSCHFSHLASARFLRGRREAAHLPRPGRLWRGLGVCHRGGAHGVVYQDQSDGYACAQYEQEGYLVPPLGTGLGEESSSASCAGGNAWPGVAGGTALPAAGPIPMHQVGALLTW
ncbi:DUF6210 family protein [Streptomyces sp. NBC_01589]|uniref:DUF6210 family protein n=1 Tax=Streptomyces sp. NBC_01589 TaxID=2975886 RepID=UPI00386E5813